MTVLSRLIALIERVAVLPFLFQFIFYGSTDLRSFPRSRFWVLVALQRISTANRSATRSSRRSLLESHHLDSSTPRRKEWIAVGSYGRCLRDLATFALKLLWCLEHEHYHNLQSVC